MAIQDEAKITATPTNGSNGAFSRRKTLVVLFFSGLAALFFKFSSLVMTFLQPPGQARGFGEIVDLGPIHELPPPGSAPVLNPNGRFWLIHEAQGVSAIQQRCTHLDCLFSWDREKELFVCPCHGSEFDRSGFVLRGPATRDLDRFVVQLADSEGALLAESSQENGDPLEVGHLLTRPDPVAGETQEESPTGRLTLQVDTGSLIAGRDRG